MNSHVYICNETNRPVVDWAVVERIASLIELQRSFFRKRDKRTLEECKRREAAFLEWYVAVKEKLQSDGNL